MARTKRWVSEFAVVVVGVLVALAVDSAYQQQVDARIGREYQTRISAELRSADELLDEFDRAFSRNLTAAAAARPFFYEGASSVDPDQLVADLYNLGRDLPRRFDTSTYDDLISTGRLELIPADEVRERILSAYKSLAELEQWLSPQRDEYLNGVRGWIPVQMIDRIREECPDIAAPEWVCAGVDLDDRSLATVLQHLRTDEALLSFQLREQGVAYTITLVSTSRGAVEAALEALN